MSQILKTYFFELNVLKQAPRHNFLFEGAMGKPGDKQSEPKH